MENNANKVLVSKDIMYERHGPLWPVFAGQTGDGAYVKCLQVRLISSQTTIPLLC